MSDAVEAQIRMECLKLAREIVKDHFVPCKYMTDDVLLTARRLYDFVTADQTEEVLG